MGDAPAVAVLLLNWRKADLTLQCLGDLLAVDDVALRVLAMDNGSGDGSAEALRAAAARPESRGRVEVLAFDTNLGFAAAMNRGIAWAQRLGAPATLVLNNDVRMPKDVLRPLAAVLANDPRAAAVAPTILRPDGAVWAQGGALAFRPNGLVLLGHGGPPASAREGPFAVDFVPGACALFRTADLVEAGGFDESYFMYWEDVELCRRLRARGRRVLWLPWVRVTHAAGQSSGGAQSPLRKFLMASNGVRYLRRHGTPRQWAAFALFDVLALPLALGRSLLGGGLRGAWAKACGVAAGLRGHRASAADVDRWGRG